MEEKKNQDANISNNNNFVSLLILSLLFFLSKYIDTTKLLTCIHTYYIPANENLGVPAYPALAATIYISHVKKKQTRH